MQTLFDKNLLALKSFRPAVYDRLGKYKAAAIGTLIRTREGCFSLVLHGEHQKVPAYQLENPWKEVELQLNAVPEDTDGLLFFLGAGLMYGPLLALQKRKNIQAMAIVEPSLDLFFLALKVMDLRTIICSEKVALFLGETDWTQVEQFTNSQQRSEEIYLIRHPGSLQWKKQCYSTLEDQLVSILQRKDAGESSGKKRQQWAFENRLENLSLLRKFSTLDNLDGFYAGKPAVLVGRGPSLKASMELISKLVGRCCVIAAIDSVEALSAAGIVPDFVIAEDPGPEGFERVASLVGHEHPFSFIASLDTYPLLLQRMMAKNIYFAFDASCAGQWLAGALGLGPCLDEVHHPEMFMLAAAVRMGFGTVLLAGYEAIADDAGASVYANVQCGGTGNLSDQVRLLSEDALAENLIDRRGLEQAQRVFQDEGMKLIAPEWSGLVHPGVKRLSSDAVLEVLFHEEPTGGAVLDDAAGDAGSDRRPEQFVERVIEILNVLQGAYEDGCRAAKKLEGVFNHFARLVGQSGSPEAYLQHSEQFAEQLEQSRETLTQLNQWQGIWDQLPLVTQAEAGQTAVMPQTENNENKSAALPYKQLLENLRYTVHVLGKLVRGVADYSQRIGRQLNYFQDEDQLLALRRARKNDPAALCALFDFYMQHGESCSGVRLFDDLRQSSAEKEAMFFVRLGQAQAMMFMHEKAEASWQSALSLRPELEGELQHWRQREAGRWCEHLGHFSSGLWRDSLWHLGALHIDLGSILRKRPALKQNMGRWFEKKDASQDNHAVLGKLLESTASICDELPEWFYQKSQWHYADRDTVAAVHWLVQGLQKAPDKALWHAQLALLLLEQKVYEEAVRCLETAVQLDAEQAVHWESIGDILCGQGDFDGAVAAYERFFIALPKRVVSLCKMGQAYLLMNNMKAAKACYVAALQITPGDQDIERHIRLIEYHERPVSLSTVISYCSLDDEFIHENIASVKEVSSDIIVVCADHLFNGEKENLDFIRRVCRQEQVNLKVVEWSDRAPNRYWHNHFRWVGFNEAAASEYFLFLDSDEIFETRPFALWYRSNECLHYDAMDFRCYWYFRERRFRAVQQERAGFLVRGGALCKEHFFSPIERQGMWVGRTKRGVLGINDEVLLHHYSWARNKEGMIKKVGAWGHSGDRDWKKLVEQEFSRGFSGTDFVHGYSYTILGER